MERVKKEVFIYDDVNDSLLLRVENQLHEANGADLEVRIHCLGGDVNVGFMIYDSLRRYAAKNKAHITTIAEGECASSATIFFLSGDKRLINENQRLYIHEAWYPQVGGTASELRKYADEAEAATLRVANHYAKHTNLTLEQALEEMRKDNYLSNENALNFRFAHDYDRILKPINKLKTSDMSKPKQNLFNTLKNLLAPKSASNLIVKTVTQEELDFYELEEGATPQVGDKARIGNAPAGDALPDGEVLVTEGEQNVKYKFEGETLTEKEVEETLSTEQMEELLVDAVKKAEEQNATIEAKNEIIKELQNKLSKYEKVENSFKSEVKETPSKEKEKVSNLLNNINKLK